MTFLPAKLRPWKNEPDPLGPPGDPATATPINAAALTDLEARIETGLEAVAAVSDAETARAEAAEATKMPASTTLDAVPGAVADVNLDGHKLTNVADATAATDALNRETGDARYDATGSAAAAQASTDAETIRAEAAEAELDTDLGEEATRAQTAEAALALDISAEVTRAEGAEGALTSSLASEVTRAEAAETANATAIDAETARAEAAEATRMFVALEFYGHSQTYGGASGVLRGTDARLAALLGAEDRNRTKGGSSLSWNEQSPYLTTGNGGWAHIYRWTDNLWPLVPALYTSVEDELAHHLAGMWEAKRDFAMLWFGWEDVALLGPANLGPFQNALETAVSRLRAAVVFEESDSSITYPTGVWTATIGGTEPTKYQSGSGYMQSDAGGGSVQIAVPASFPGGTAVVAFLCDPAGHGAAWDFTVDGIAAGSLDARNVNAVNVDGSSPMWTPVVKRLTGLAAGAHTIVATTSAVNGMALFDCWWAEGRTSPQILLPKALRLDSYSLFATWPYTPTDADAASINSIIDTVAGRFDADVVTADPDSVIAKSATFFVSDGAHLNDRGHAVVAAYLFGVIAAHARTADKHAASPGPPFTTSVIGGQQNVIEAGDPVQIPLQLRGRRAGDQTAVLLDLLSMGVSAKATLALGRTVDDVHLSATGQIGQTFSTAGSGDQTHPGDCTLRTLTGGGSAVWLGSGSTAAMYASAFGIKSLLTALFTSGSPTGTPLVVKGLAAQTAVLTTWQDSTGANLAQVYAGGTFTSVGSFLGGLGTGLAAGLSANGVGLDVSAVAGAATATGTQVGDKIALFSNGATGYGIGIQTLRLVLYVASGGAVAVRTASASGAASSGSDGVLLNPTGQVFSYGTDTSKRAFAAWGTPTDANPLWRVRQGDGQMAWGAGGVNVVDVTFARSSPGVLQLTGALTAQPISAATIGLTVKGAAAQTADLLQLQDSTGAALLNFTAAGKITQVEYAFSTWKTLPQIFGYGVLTSTDSNQTYVCYYGGKIALGGASSAVGVFYLDPGDYGAGSRTVKLRLRAHCVTNAVAPGVSITVGLSPVTGFGGASGAAPTITTVGASVCSVTFTPVASNGGGVLVSSTVNFPAAGFYVISVTPSGAPAAGAQVLVMGQLQYQQV